MENWKDIKGYEGLYQISDKGVVKGLKRTILSRWGTPKVWKEKTIKTIVDHLGYCRVSLCKNGTVKAAKIHRLVAETFLQGEGHINHKDGNKQNNNLSNLEFCTSRENLRHAFTTGLRPKKYLRTIICNETQELFTCQMDIARKIKLSSVMVSSHLKGNTSHLRGLTYKYIE
jgi:hypothetical protein